MPTERQSQGCICPKYSALVSEVERLKEQLAHLKRENDRYRRDLGRMHASMVEKPFGLSTQGRRIKWQLTGKKAFGPVEFAYRSRRASHRSTYCCTKAMNRR